MARQIGASLSNIQRIEQVGQLIETVEIEFNQLAAIHGAVHFRREASFALEILKNNSYLAQVAYNNQDSLKRAIINVAAVGLTLNPVSRFAYLVPRDEKICLDVSYIGYVKLGTDTGAILWAQAKVVREKDIYEYRGAGEQPLHQYKTFEDRGNIVGVYCMAKTVDGDYLVDEMPISEVYRIRDRYSVSWHAHKSKGKKSPWATDEEEMIKKTVVRRASKMWPKSAKTERLDKAIEVSNESEVVQEHEAHEPSAPTAEETQSSFTKIRTLLQELGRGESEYVDYLIRVHKRNIQKLEDLVPNEAAQAISMLELMVKTYKNKAAKDKEKTA